MDFMQFLTFVLIVLAVIVIVILLGMLVTYQHDSLITSAIDTRKDIKKLRGNRYVTAKAILDNASSYDVVSLRNLLESYPKIRNEKDEIAWEEKWLPAMKKYVGNSLSDAASTATAFVGNEMELSSARESLERTESSLARMEGNKFLMWFIRTFVGLSKKAKEMPARVETIRGQATNGVDSVKGVVNRFTGSAVDADRNVIPQNIRKYGDQTYFATNEKDKSSK